MALRLLEAVFQHPRYLAKDAKSYTEYFDVMYKALFERNRQPQQAMEVWKARYFRKK